MFEPDDLGKFSTASSQVFDDGSKFTQYGNGDTVSTDEFGVVSFRKSNTNKDFARGEGLPTSRHYNPLSGFSSHTYNLSLYLTTPESMNSFYELGRTAIEFTPTRSNGFYVVAQSGGKSKETPGTDLDITIDNLKITQSTAGSATGMSLGTTNLTFELFEPHSISFLTKLKEAENELRKVSTLMTPATGKSANLNHFFMLAVRFYGYDSSGKIVKGDRVAEADASRSDASAIFERFYPVRIKHFRSKFGASINVHQVEASSTSEFAGLNIRSRIKGGTNVSGSTVDQVLTNLLNEQNTREAKSNKKGIPASFSVVFPEGSELIKQATVTNATTDKDKSRTTTPASSTSSKSNEATANKATANKTVQNYSFKNDTPLVQAIEEIISHSSYIKDSLTSLAKSEELLSDGTSTENKVNKTAIKKFEWFYITPVPRIIGYDKIVNQWVHHIDYVVTPYQISYLPSPYLANLNTISSGFKRYDYVYTGTNSEIISYEQNMDLAYFVLGTNTNSKTKEDASNVSTPVEKGRLSNVARTYEIGRGSEDVDNVRTSFLDPSAFKSAKLVILGDPDYLTQSETKSSLLKNTVRQALIDQKTSTFVQSSGQMLVEIRFRDVEDYDLSTGLMKRNPNIQLIHQIAKSDDRFKEENNNAGIFFTIKDIVSTFKSGVFQIELSLLLVDVKTPDDKNKSEKNTNQNTDTGRQDNVPPRPAQDLTRPSPWGGRTNQTVLTSSPNDDKGTIYDPLNKYGKLRETKGSIYAQAARERTDFFSSVSNKLFGPRETKLVNLVPGAIDPKTLLPKRN